MHADDYHDARPPEVFRGLSILLDALAIPFAFVWTLFAIFLLWRSARIYSLNRLDRAMHTCSSATHQIDRLLFAWPKKDIQFLSELAFGFSLRFYYTWVCSFGDCIGGQVTRCKSLLATSRLAYPLTTIAPYRLAINKLHSNVAISKLLPVRRFSNVSGEIKRGGWKRNERKENEFLILNKNEVF